jgi:3-oxoacyl-[acyl-carrier-protein] synthase II
MPAASSPGPKAPRAAANGGGCGAAVITAVSAVGPLGVTLGTDVLAYLDAGPSASPGQAPFEAALHLDLTLARRMDRLARMLSIAMSAALPGPVRSEIDPARIGAVAGHAYGQVDGSAEFVLRLYEKGARFASPAAFPNLVPSSPVGHAAIYLGLQGPVLSTADLTVTGEAAIQLALELLQAGQADAMLAASAEPASRMVDRVLGPLCVGSGSWQGARTEGASVLLIESAAHAKRRGARPLARIARSIALRCDPRSPEARDMLRELAPRSGRFALVLARDDRETLDALDATGFGAAPRHILAPRSGHHEGLGALAASVAVALIASGRADEVLTVGTGPGRFAALLFGAP